MAGRKVFFNLGVGWVFCVIYHFSKFSVLWPLPKIYRWTDAKNEESSQDSGQFLWRVRTVFSCRRYSRCRGAEAQNLARNSFFSVFLHLIRSRLSTISKVALGFGPLPPFLRNRFSYRTTLRRSSEHCWQMGDLLLKWNGSQFHDCCS